VFNDLVEFGGQSAMSIYQLWIPFVVNAIGDPGPLIRAYAAKGMGILAEYSPNLFRQILPDVLNRLNSMIVHKDSRIKTRVQGTEIAIAAVGKLIYFHSSQIELSQVLPIWLNYLPVSEDVEQCKIIYQFLCHFFRYHTEILLGENCCNLPKILGIFADVLGTPIITPDTAQTIISILKQMETQFPVQLMQSAWESLNFTQQRKFTLSIFLQVVELFLLIRSILEKLQQILASS
jgi:hypothetical protein